MKSSFKPGLWIIGLGMIIAGGLIEIIGQGPGAPIQWENPRLWRIFPAIGFLCFAIAAIKERRIALWLRPSLFLILLAIAYYCMVIALDTVGINVFVPHWFKNF